AGAGAGRLALRADGALGTDRLQPGGAEDRDGRIPSRPLRRSARAQWEGRRGCRCDRRLCRPAIQSRRYRGTSRGVFDPAPESLTRELAPSRMCRLGPIRAQSARRIFSGEFAAEKVSLQFQPEKALASLFSSAYCTRRPAIFSYDPRLRWRSALSDLSAD